MAKFVIECPHCGKYAEASTGFFAKKKIDCTCGYVINVKTDKYTARTCHHCGNTVLFDQSQGDKALCPVCKQSINTSAEQSKTFEFSCSQCGVRLISDKAATAYTCPVCDCKNDVRERLMAEKVKNEGLASVIKYEGDNDTLVWKHPVEDFNWGSQLIVHESQEAIFFRDGQALDTFGAGRYTLETQQLPVLEKLYKLPTAASQTFHSEVYYFNLVTQMALKWGTPDKVRLIDPLSDSPISIGARGILNFRISNSRKLLMKLIGTAGGMKRQDVLGDGNSDTKNYFRSTVQTTVSTYLADAIRNNNIDILQIDQQRLILSEALLVQIAPIFLEFGLEVTNFVVEGIVLPQPGELGYDAVQTLIKIHQCKLTEAAIENEKAIKLAEMEAKKQVDVQQQANLAEIEVARRGVVSAKGETNVLEAQLEGQKKLAETQADVAAERLRMQLEMERKAQTASIEAEEMRLKGYSQKDVIQSDVQKAYAESIGNMGPAISAGGNVGSSVIGDMLGLGVGMAAVSAVAPQIGNMMQGLRMPVVQTVPPSAQQSSGWNCPACGKQNITFNFCPDCGIKRPEAPAAWNCPNCGMAGISFNFCPNCGTKKPESPSSWICPDCGTQNITTNFCPNCGRKRG